ncbi:protein kinase [Nocardia uniformis]|uniref:non-specific serine/threonine protein kinase n=1 Tax=Nocardia uniformis TaxID=53432 RepID=A0A849BUE9_9NOCA|nr:serine/threonine-protein kinase [Nocardia uniformis]NNH68476.1 protein kinase [Nocardia uniformis]
MGLQPGAVFAGFTIERLLGTGGMGMVYLARHPRLQRRVALKVLTNTFTVDPKARAAFDREATLAAGLDHPNIVSVYDRNATEDPALWLAMRYIDGGDAAGLLSDHPDGLDPARAVRLLSDAAHALDYAHAQGVLHRDVKPANLLIENDHRDGERAVLTDFGIARTLDDTVTLSGIAATFAYAAPERFSETPADHRADIYSLGCTLFQLLTGQPPFARKDQAAVIGAHLTAPPPAPRELRPELPAELDAVIATALAKSPQDRYPTCAALADAAARALPLSAVTARPEPARPVAVSSDAALEQVAATTVARHAEFPGDTPVAKETAAPTALRDAQSPVRAQIADEAAAATVVHNAVSLAKGEPHNPSPRWSAGPVTEPTADGSARRRFTVVSGLVLAAAGVAVVAALAVRGDSPATGTTISTPTVPQQVTSTTTPIPSSTPVPSEPPPVDTPPADPPAPVDTPMPADEPPVEQYAPTYTVQRPANPAPQAPAVVPQTRAHQWPG